MLTSIRGALRNNNFAALLRGPKRPPGPNAALITESVGLYTNPEVMHQNASQSGDMTYYRMFVWPIYQLNHPDHVRHVLQEKARIYSKRTIDYRLLRRLGGEGLLTSEGELWKKQRRMIQPLFSRQHVEDLAPMMLECTENMLDRWRAKKDPAQSIDIVEEMTRLTLHIVGRALFDLDLLGASNEVGAAFETASKELMLLGPVEIVWSGAPTPRNKRIRQSTAKLHHIVTSMIDERRKDILRAPNKPRRDLVSLLLQARDEETQEPMSHAQIRDELLTMMIAGHETTANTLSWTLYLLSKHPKIAHYLQQDCRAHLQGRAPLVSDLPAIPLLSMVIQEAMRLYPPAWALTRRAEEDDEIDGYTIPAGSTVVISPFSTHRHPGFWKDPGRFDPTRFFPETEKQRHRFAYFPFGGGQRMCIGKGFAMLEAQLILAMLMQHVEVNVPAHHYAEPEALITLRPKGELPATLRWLD
ncbi:MAG: cytochrome P450 [Myxococcales bacterium]|nr:cytochrome P450 [Myxococcales bacterium]